MTVYVVQDTKRFDRATGEMYSVHDISPASEYGEFRYLLSPTAAPWDPASILSDLTEGLRDFSERDHLLMIGNPILCSMAAVVAYTYSPRIKFLQWNGKDQRYFAIEADLASLDEPSPLG